MFVALHGSCTRAATAIPTTSIIATTTLSPLMNITTTIPIMVMKIDLFATLPVPHTLLVTLPVAGNRVERPGGYMVVQVTPSVLVKGGGGAVGSHSVVQQV